MKNLFIVILLFVISTGLMAQDTQDKGLDAMTIETVEAPLKFLASDWTEGREVGTKGAYMAADYIASVFMSFAAEGIPVISLFTGLHRDYHFPNDELEFIDLEKMTNIIKLTYLGLNDILETE